MTPADLREIRRRAGLSQAALARLFNLAEGRTIRRYEAGDFVPPGPVLKLYELLRDGVISPSDDTATRGARSSTS